MTSMTPERWQRIRAVLDRALARPETERKALIEAACVDDPQLRRDALNMLDEHDAAVKNEFLGRFESAADRHPSGDGHPLELETSSVVKAETDVPYTDETHRDPEPDAARSSVELRGGRFEILREFARGGLGIVYLAMDRELGREVAVKEMHERFLNDLSARFRFTREAEITGRLEHPGIAPVYAFGRTDDGRPYYAMKLVAGESMETAIQSFHGRADGESSEESPRRSRRSDFAGFDFKKLLGHFASLCSTIEYAHAKGYVHRDIKPRNVHLGKLGETVVLDWGLAKPVKANEPGGHDRREAAAAMNGQKVSSACSTGLVTKHGDVFGTPAFMSPEQAAGDHEQLGPASDIFSLGSTLYSLLAGHAPIRPRKGESSADLLERLRTGDWSCPRVVDANTPRPLAAICNKAMALAPKDRYPTAGALAEDIGRYMADEPTTVWQESTGERLLRWQRRYPGLRMGLAAAISILLIAVIGLSWAAVRLAAEAHRANNEARRADEEATQARLAKQQTRREAARRESESLRQAAARGDWRTVLDGLDSPRLIEQENPIQLILWRIDALNALNRSGEARRLTDNLVARPDLGEFRGRVLLWKADANWAFVEGVEGETNTVTSETLVNEAIDAGLPPADLAYAQALIAHTFPDSIAHLEQAVGAELFHRRAIVLLCMDLIFVGEVNKAATRAQAASYLFPDDPSFPFIMAIAATFQRDDATAEKHLSQIAKISSERYAEEARWAVKLLKTIVNFDDGVDPFAHFLGKVLPVLAELKRLENSPSLGDSFELTFPPQLRTLIFKMIRGVGEWMVAQVSPSRRETAIRAFAEAAEVFPTAEAHYLHGRALYLSGRLEEAAEVLEKATEAPASISGFRRTILFNAVSIRHLAIQEHGSPTNVQASEKSLVLREEYLHMGDPSREHLSLCYSMLCEHPRTRTRVIPLLERALDKAPDDAEIKSMLARAYARQGASFLALQLAEEVLNTTPDDQRAEEVRAEALETLSRWRSGRLDLPPESDTEFGLNEN